MASDFFSCQYWRTILGSTQLYCTAFSRTPSCLLLQHPSIMCLHNVKYHLAFSVCLEQNCRVLLFLLLREADSYPHFSPSFLKMHSILQQIFSSFSTDSRRHGYIRGYWLGEVQSSRTILILFKLCPRGNHLATLRA